MNATINTYQPSLMSCDYLPDNKTRSIGPKLSVRPARQQQPWLILLSGRDVRCFIIQAGTDRHESPRAVLRVMMTQWLICV